MFAIYSVNKETTATEFVALFATHEQAVEFAEEYIEGDFTSYEIREEER